jgi:type I site-specific restriction-modification system R (restriction) subunit
MRTRILAAEVAAFFTLASLAAAAEISRSEYKAAVEPICKTNSKANDRILKPVRKLVKKNKLKPAGKRFLKAAAALQKTYRQLKAVPQPTADEAKLAKWLSYVKKEADLFTSGGKALKSGNKHKAQKFVNKLTSNANQANATVLAFSFHYCRFEPAKYT